MHPQPVRTNLVSGWAAALAALAASASPLGTPGADDGVQLTSLLDGTAVRRLAAWRPVHDRVMGGVSDGLPTPGDGGVLLSGHVSLENNGGFASFRREVEWPDLTGQDGLRLRVRGDGRVYKLSLRTDDAWDGVSWQAPFATKAGTWTVVDLAFEDLVPSWRGRLVVRAGPFDPRRIRQLGLVAGDGKEGDFSLELAAVDAWRATAPGDHDATADAPDGSRAAAADRGRALAALIDARATVPRLLDALRWDERLLVISAPRERDKRTTLQLGRFLADADGLAARELRLVELLGTAGGRLAGRTLTRAQVDALRDRWALPADRWSVALVGKDGGLKELWDAPVMPAEVHALIDVMPMRRREMSERSEG